MIAFALMSLVFGGAVLAHFGSAYWAIAAQTSNEGLYKAKTMLEEMRAVVKKDFRLASSSPFSRVSDASCDGGGLCYFAAADISDLSPCSKYAEAKVTWQVQSYPTSTVSLFTNLTDTKEALNLGGDCPTTLPAGDWHAALQTSSASGGGAAPTGIDVLGSVSYITSSAAPYFSIAAGGSFISFGNAFSPMDGLNAIDVARDTQSGRIYAYAAVASTSVQLEVVDVTDPQNPSSVAKLRFNGVDQAGSFPQGWRVAYYGARVYVTARETTGPEFHVVDVSNPALPVELGSRELNTSVYGMVVRDMLQGTTLKRLAFLVTSSDSKEIIVLDVTNPSFITEFAAVDVPGTADGRSIFLSGNTLYAGKVSNSGPELYTLDVSDFSGALSVAGGTGREIGGTPESIRVSGSLVYVANTKNNAQLQVWEVEGGVLSSSAMSSSAVSGFAGGADLEGDALYVTSSANPRLRIIESQ